MKCMEISIYGNTFKEAKETFDTALTQTLRQMQEKKALKGAVNLRLDIELVQETENVYSEARGNEEISIYNPRFSHTVTSKIEVKSEKKGKVEGEYKIEYDTENEMYVLKVQGDQQISFFDEEAKKGVGEVVADTNEQEPLPYTDEQV